MYRRIAKSGRHFTSLLLLLVCSIHALAIDLDATFGSGGKFTTTFSTSGDPSSQATRVFVQPSGRIVLVGRHNQRGPDGPMNGYAIAGLTADGTLDTGFGNGGKVLVWNAFQLQGLADAAMLPNGSLLLLSQLFALSGMNRPDLARYTADGQPDGTFTADLNIWGNATLPVRLSLGANGKIYALLRRSTSDDYVIVRLNANGTRDTAFGTNGVRSISFNRLAARIIAAVHELSDGKVLVTGTYQASGFDSHLFAARYDSGMNLDRTFGLQGIVRVSIPDGSVYASTSVVQPDGNVLIGGHYTFLGSNALLVRLTGRGRLDTGFGTGGISMSSINAINSINGITLAPDGTIHVAGSTGDKTIPNNLRMFVARYSTAGVRESFAVTNFITNRDAAGFGVGLQPDGRTLAAGYSVNPDDNFSQFAVARFVP